MAEWTVEEPQAIDIEEEVRDLQVRLVAGHVDVVTTDGDTARVEVTETEGAPVAVSVKNGRLVVAHEELSWDGVLGWLRKERKSARVSIAVPERCEVTLGVVSADAVVAGVRGRVRARSVSGEIVLDGVEGNVDAESVSGDVDARRLAGRLSFKTVSGELTLVAGRPDRVQAKSVSGDVALDLTAGSGVDIDVTTVSGDVTVRLPQQTGLEVDVTSMSGDLSSAFDGLSVESRPGRRRLRGRVGDGAGAFNGKTVSGSVALLSRGDGGAAGAEDVQ